MRLECWRAAGLSPAVWAHKTGLKPAARNGLMADQTNFVAAEGEAVEGLAGAAVVVVVAVDAPGSSGTVPVQDLIVVMVDDHRGRVDRHARYHYRGHDHGRIVGRPPEA